jgi:hypothetical protein
MSNVCELYTGQCNSFEIRNVHSLYFTFSNGLQIQFSEQSLRDKSVYALEFCLCVGSDYHLLKLIFLNYFYVRLCY